MKKALNILKNTLIIILLIIVFFSIFINIKFNDISFENLIYTLQTSQGANCEIVAKCILFIAILLFLTILLVFLFIKLITIFNKNKLFNKIITKLKSLNWLMYSILIIILITIIVKLLDIDIFIKNKIIESELFDNYYVNPADVKLTFPKNKRNLIYIYVESLESSGLSKENGGLVKTSYTPYLEKLGIENINFSHNNKLGGAYQLNETALTIGALVAHTSGIPLKSSVKYNIYDAEDNFIPGAYTLGDILLENGYNNYFMIGSKAQIGRRDSYFTNHGNYTIYDYEHAKKEGFISEDYYVWWGYEDQKLFEYAKEKLLKISQNDKPFNFTMLTVDTHFTDGYLDETCENKFDDKYANAFLCSDSKVYSFISWLKQQDFYENTTVIITGDHLTMQQDFFSENNDNRNVYNVFINSVIKPINEKNRIFSTLDMFPTTLASLGVKIENNKLGLGVNLFSNEQTLLEKYGIEYINEEILKKSTYYNKYILNH